MIDPRLTEAVIPTWILTAVVQLGERHGCVIERWLAGTGLTRRQLAETRTRVSFRQASVMLRRALRDLPPGPVGLEIAGRDPLVAFGMVGLAMRSCATGAEAFELGLRLRQAAGALADVVAEIDGDEVAFVLRERAPEPGLLPFLCEEALGSLLRLTWAILGPGHHPVRLELRYPAPAYAAEYRRFFRCPVRFGTGASRLLLPAGLLDLPIATYDPAIRDLAEDACHRILDVGRASRDIVHTVESIVGEDTRVPMTMTAVADRLSITERTLRRQLAAAGIRFSEVRDRVRERRATYLILESRLPVKEIAGEVGFSDAREFRRAYARWTGRPPSAARRQQR